MTSLLKPMERDPHIDEVIQQFQDSIPADWLNPRWLVAIGDAWQAAVAPATVLLALANHVQIRGTFTAALTKVKQLHTRKASELDRLLKSCERSVREHAEKRLTLDEVAAFVQSEFPAYVKLREQVEVVTVLRDHLFGLRGDMDDRREITIERAREERSQRREDNQAV